jgi:hypothetical protein
MTIPPVNTMHNQFMGNWIGVATDGVTPLGNGGRGICLGIFEIGSYFAGFCPENEALNNIIANNGMAGISVWENPQSSTNADRNTLRQNDLWDNGGLGVDLDDNGVTFNDPGDLDTGANEGRNFPAVLQAGWLSGNTTISGVVEGVAEVQVYKAKVDPTGYGEGQRFLGSTFPDPLGRWILTVSGLAVGDDVTAIALDATGMPYRDTSEFGPCAVVQDMTGVDDAVANAGFGVAVSGASPFRSAVWLGYEIPRDSPAQLRIYALSGRLVRTLIHGTIGGGAHAVRWDGRDDHGLRAAAGVYVVRLAAGGRQANCKVVKLD